MGIYIYIYMYLSFKFSEFLEGNLIFVDEISQY